MKNILFLFLILIASLTTAQTNYSEINYLISQGNFSEAQIMIEGKLVDRSLPEAEKCDLRFQIELMDRIKKDFKRTRKDIFSALTKYYPDLNDIMLNNWEKDNSLEMKIIDGEKRYFNNAVPNLFRINKEAKKQKEFVDGTKVDPLDTFLKDYVQQVYAATANSERVALPVKMKIKYSLTVKPNVVPAGEVIRCWLPYPKENIPRQTDVELLSISNKDYIIADDKNLQKTIYFEGTTKKDEPTKFEMVLSYTSRAEFVNLFKSKMAITFNQTKDIFDDFTKEEFPHLVFTERIKTLSKQIVGDEKDPLQILKKIFTWVDENTPWASAREYSTIPNITEYSLEQKHGDCGIQTLVFMTLCRYNGIPAKWQSGWMMHPPEINLHDWCEIYVDQYGWIPVDQSFGIKNYLSEDQKYFYLGGIDAYRLIVNDDISQPLFPAKIFPRSETVDFQRGEVEWRGGNLYFDLWNYKMEIDYL